LDYNKYKPRPSKPSSHHDTSYSAVTKPPYKEQHHSESYYSAGRPSHQKLSSSGYHHTSHSYIKVHNEPSYYYLEERKVMGNANRNVENVVPEPGFLAADLKSSIIQNDSLSMQQELRTALDDGENIPADM